MLTQVGSGSPEKFRYAMTGACVSVILWDVVAFMPVRSARELSALNTETEEAV